MSIIIYYDAKERPPRNKPSVHLLNLQDNPEVLFKPINEYKTSNDNNFLLIECFGKHEESGHFEYLKFSRTMEKEPGQPSKVDDPRFLKNYLKMHSWEFGITDTMKRDIDDGKLKVLLNKSLEGFWDLNTDYVSALLDIPKHSIIILTGDAETEGKYDIDSYYVNFWERSLIRLMDHIRVNENMDRYEPFYTQVKNIKNKLKRPYCATFYNRTIRYHRVIAMAAFYKRDALKNLLWSWGGDLRVIQDQLQEHKNHKDLMVISKLGEEYRTAVDDILRWPNIQAGKPAVENLSVNLAYVVNDSHVKQTYYQIINETWVSDNYGTNFLSEKSFKPFMQGQPFMQHGDANNIKSLKKHGYHTFDNIFDQSYNEIVDSTERLHKLIDVVLNTNDAWISDGPDILYENLDSIEHNFDNLLKAEERFGIPLDKIIYR